MKILSIFFLLVVLLNPVTAQYAVQFDSVSVALNGVDTDTIFISFRDKPGRAWRIDTTGYAHLESAKVGQRILFPDSVYVILQRSNVSGTADSFRVSYAAGHPTSTTAAIGVETYLIAAASTFADVTTNTVLSISLLRQSSWFRILVSQGDLVGAVKTYIRLIFVRKERTN